MPFDSTRELSPSRNEIPLAVVCKLWGAKAEATSETFEVIGLREYTPSVAAKKTVPFNSARAGPLLEMPGAVERNEAETAEKALEPVRALL